MRSFTLILLVIFLLYSCNGKKTKQATTPVLYVYCGASLSQVISSMADDFEEKNNCKIRLNFASSGTLARQISSGAGADVYISANKKWAQYVSDLELLPNTSPTEIAHNRLVLISPLDCSLKVDSFSSATDFNSYLQGGLLVIGDPAHVPAGKYAEEALTALGTYDDVQSRLLKAKDVVTARSVVEMGEAQLGIVYYSDAVQSKKVRVVGQFQENLHSPIAYVAVPCSSNALTAKFISYIKSKEVVEKWESFGFTALCDTLP